MRMNRRDKRERKGRRDKEGEPRKQTRERYERKRVCRFCANPGMTIDYKDARLLAPFVTERGKIVPRRITGNCAYHQRKTTTAIKRARILALLSFTVTQVRW